MNEREIILDILMEVIEGGKYSHIVLRETLDKYQFADKKKRAFITRVTEGTIEHMIELDYIINQYSKVKVKKMKPLIRNLIRSAVYQMKYMDSVPNSAVCNESVKLAVKRGFGGLRGFVNGVLRNISRNLDSVKLPGKEEGALYYSVKYSLPEWIVERWLKQYGEETLVSMGEAFLAEGKTTIRVNTSKCTKEELISMLESEGVTVENHPYLPYALEISRYDSLYFLNSFQMGLFQVQDISSMLVSEIANPKCGNYIIDVCAAPGGKALHMADKLEGTGTVEARDLTDYKISLIHQNVERSQMRNINAVKWDATILDESVIEKADIVIADLPCSGLGVMGKKTDLKYRIKQEDLTALAQLQKDILKNVCQYVKKDGVLVYSTCTINEEENEDNVDFIIEELGLEVVDIKPFLCEELKSWVSSKGGLQLLPGIHHSDGFFIAAFKKI
ncbi:MAG: 16S rRNA (cytosine(967)-C(5))-methyltransferase RsmB [Eubacteriales bacterium]